MLLNATSLGHLEQDVNAFYVGKDNDSTYLATNGLICSMYLSVVTQNGNYTLEVLSNKAYIALVRSVLG